MLTDEHSLSYLGALPQIFGVPEVHAVLAAPGARIADVGCGEEWSTVALARANRRRASRGSTWTYRRCRRPGGTRRKPG